MYCNENQVIQISVVLAFGVCVCSGLTFERFLRFGFMLRHNIRRKQNHFSIEAIHNNIESACLSHLFTRKKEIRYSGLAFELFLSLLPEGYSNTTRQLYLVSRHQFHEFRRFSLHSITIFLFDEGQYFFVVLDSATVLIRIMKIKRKRMYARSAYDLNHTDDVDCIFCKPCCMCTHKVIHIESREAQQIHTTAHSILPQAIHTPKTTTTKATLAAAAAVTAAAVAVAATATMNHIIITTAAILWRAHHAFVYMFKRQCERACMSVCVCSRSKWINAKETTQFGWRIQKSSNNNNNDNADDDKHSVREYKWNYKRQQWRRYSRSDDSMYVQQENLFDHVCRMCGWVHAWNVWNTLCAGCVCGWFDVHWKWVRKWAQGCMWEWDRLKGSSCIRFWHRSKFVQFIFTEWQRICRIQ